MQIPEWLALRLYNAAYRTDRGFHVSRRSRRRAEGHITRDHCVLFAVLDGDLAFQGPDYDQHIPDGGLILLPSGRSYHMHVQGAKPVVAMMPVVQLAAINQSCDPLRTISLPMQGQHRDTARLRHVLQRGKALRISETNLHDRLQANQIMNELLLELLSVASGAGIIPVEDPDIPLWIQEAQGVIAKRFADPDLQVGDIAAAIGRSPAQLYQGFRQYLQVPPKTFLHRYRLDIAKRLIEQAPNQTQRSIMLRCGYRSRSLFSRLFSETYGAPPSHFH